MAEVVGTAFVRIRAITAQLSKDIEDSIKKGADDADVDGSGSDVGERFARSAKDSIEEGLGDIGKHFDIGDDADDSGRDAGVNWSAAFNDELGQGLSNIGSFFKETIDVGLSGIGDHFNNTLTDDLRRVNVEDHGRGIGRRLSEGAEEVIDRTFSEGGFISRKMDSFFKRQGDKGGGIFAGGFRTGLVRSLSALAPVLIAPIGGLISLISQYIITLVGQIGFLVQATVGAGVAMGGAFALALAGLIPLLSAFEAETPALERLQKAAEDLAEDWEAVGKAAQRELFPALEDIFDVVRDLIPITVQYATEVGVIAANFVRMTGAILGSVEGQLKLEAIFNNSVTVLENLSTGALAFGEILMTLFVAVGPIADQFTQSLSQMLLRWNDLLNARAASGDLGETLQRWYDRAVQLGQALGDLFVAIWNTFSIGADVAQPFFDTFSAFAERWRAFTESTAGQDRIREVFENARAVAHEVNLLVTDIFNRLFGPTIDGDNSNLIRVLRTIREDFIPAIDDFLTRFAEQSGDALTGLAESLGELFTAMSDTGSLSVTAVILSSIAESLTLLLSLPGVPQLTGAILGLYGAFKVLSLLRIDLLFKAIGFGWTTLATAIGGPAAAGAIAAVVAALAILGGTIAFVRDQWGNLASFIPLFMGPIGIAGFVIAAVIEEFDRLKGALSAVGGFLADVGGAIGRTVGGAFLWLWQNVLVPVGNFLGGAFASAWDAVVSAIGTAASFIGDVGGSIFSGIADAVTWLWQNVLVPFGRFLTDVFPAIWNAAGTAISWFVDNVLGPIGDAINWVWQNVLVPFGGFIADQFAPVWDALVKVWQEDLLPIFRDIAGAVSDIWHNYLEPFGQWLVNTFGPYWQQISAIISPILDAIGGAIQTLWQIIIQPFIDFMKGDFVNAFLGLVGLFAPIIGLIFGGLGAAFVWLWQTVLLPIWNFIVLQFSLAWQGLIVIWQVAVLPALQLLGTIFLWLWQTILVPIWNFIVTVFTPIWSVLVAIWNGVVLPAIQLVGTILLWLWQNVLMPVWNFISSNFIPIIQTLAGNITGVLAFAISGFGDIISLVWNGIVKPFVNFLSGAFKAGVDIGKGAINGIKNAISFVGDAASAAWHLFLEPFVNWVKGAMKTAVDIGKGAWNGVKNAINAVGDAAQAAWDFVQDLIDAINDIPALPNLPGGGGGLNWRTVANPFFGADGGIFSKATPMIIGEAGKEVLLPLTKPRRARQLAAASGAYDVLLGGSSHDITFGDGAIVLQFNGATPTAAEARRIGQEVGNGITDVLARRRITSGARSA